MLTILVFGIGPNEDIEENIVFFFDTKSFGPKLFIVKLNFVQETTNMKVKKQSWLNRG
jgi:hypothetical protein